MGTVIEAGSDDGVNWKALDALAEGAGDDGAGGAPGEREPPRMTPGQEVAAMLQAFAAVVAPAMPNVAAIYTPATCAAIGAAVDPVCAKYGWLQGGFQWGAELQAVIVVVPIALATAKAVQVDVAALKAARAAREAEAARPKEAAPEGVPDA